MENGGDSFFQKVISTVGSIIHRKGFNMCVFVYIYDDLQPLTCYLYFCNINKFVSFFLVGGFNMAMLLISLVVIFFSLSTSAEVSKFPIGEASIHDIKIAFEQNRLTSRQLVEFYLGQIQKLNPILNGVIEVNPDALALADKADKERTAKKPGSLLGLAGIPIIVKDNIATKDKLNTTAGSFALLGSVVPMDAGIVKKLRRAGAIILGKASLTEWSAFRSSSLPNGWNARRGQGLNPYNSSADTCGSSSGSAISVSANMAAVSLGTETAGSILCPSSANSVVGIKPTVGLTSRAGVVPITPRQDTVGPICRTVHDAVYVLDAIVGYDPNDAVETRRASKYIPSKGYLQFLKPDGLKGKRLGIMRYSAFGFENNSEALKAYEPHLKTLRKRGAVLVDIVDTAKFDIHTVTMLVSQESVMYVEFKLAVNAYLKQLVTSQVRSLVDLIAFTKKFSKLEKLKEYGQDIFETSEKTNGIGKKERDLLLNIRKDNKEGFEKIMKENKLDAVVTPFINAVSFLSAGGYPGINVPAGYDTDEAPYGITFGGLKGSEPKLIEIAYAFEQATKNRRPPTFGHLGVRI